MLAAMTGLQLSFVIFYIAVCLLLVGVILLQKGRGGGIGSAFGGGGGASSPFGAKTGDVFTWVTVVLAGLAILTGVLGNYVLLPKLSAEEAAATPVGVQTDPGAQPAGTTTPVGLPEGAAPPSTPLQLPGVPAESAPPAGGESAPTGTDVDETSTGRDNTEQPG